MNNKPSALVVSEVVDAFVEHKLVTSMILVTIMGIAGAIIDNSYSIKLGSISASPVADNDDANQEECQG